MADGGWRMADGGWRMADGGACSVKPRCDRRKRLSVRTERLIGIVTISRPDTRG
jgi:hypothetical protein